MRGNQKRINSDPIIFVMKYLLENEKRKIHINILYLLVIRIES